MATDTILRPGEIKDILLREIEAADLHELDVEEVGTVLEVKDGIARIYGLQKAMAGEMLEVTSSETGEKITALALNLEEDNIGAVVLGDYLQLKEGDEVRRTGRVLEVPVGPAMVGRVVDALGRPIDGAGEINTTNTRKVESEAPGIIVRQPVRPGRHLRLRGHRAEGVDGGVGRRAAQGGGRDGVHDRRRRLGVRSGADAVHRPVLGLRDGRVLHVQRGAPDAGGVRRSLQA